MSRMHRTQLKNFVRATGIAFAIDSAIRLSNTGEATPAVSVGVDLLTLSLEDNKEGK